MEALLKDYKYKTATYSFIHKKEGDSLSFKDKVIGITNVILVSLSTTGNLISEMDSSNYYKIPVNLSLSAILYFSAFLSGISQYCNYSKNAEKNYNSHIRYSSLFNKIERCLATENITRDIFNTLTEEYDDIFKDSPCVSGETVNHFNKNFIKENDSSKTIPVQKSAEEDFVRNTLDPKVNFELERFMKSLNDTNT